MRTSERRLLEMILSLPTAPFREYYVQRAIERVARKLELSVRHDRYGNFYVSYHRGKSVPVAFAAHMDHPGFEVLEGGRQARGVFWGGVTIECLNGASVLSFPEPPPGTRRAETVPPTPVRGRISRVEPSPVPGTSRPRLLLDLDMEAEVSAGDFGCFDLPAPDTEGNHLRAPALDNLLSCVLILATLAGLKRRGVAADVVGVFTRAEEVGFVGAGGVLRSLHLGHQRPLVVLEMSKELPGFHMGSGPVLRVGDRMTCFDPLMDLWMSDAAAELRRQEPDFVYQRALMTGGACEASLYMLHGRQVGAIALPLGNYHNMTPEGGIGSEFVSRSDFEQTLLLLQYLAAHPPGSDLIDKQRAALDAVFTRLSPRLEPR